MGGIKGKSKFFKCNNGRERMGRTYPVQGGRRAIYSPRANITVGEKVGLRKLVV